MNKNKKSKIEIKESELRLLITSLRWMEKKRPEEQIEENEIFNLIIKLKENLKS